MSRRSCPKGKIRRASYKRKSYERRSRGSKGKPVVYVKRTKVPSTCVPATGKALSRGRKTPKREKVLPKPGKEVSLSRYGYSTHKSDAARHLALRNAAKDVGDLKILRRINLIRNYQANDEAKRIMSQDVEYMSNFHARNKRD